MTNNEEHTKKIRVLNDVLRTTFYPQLGRVMLSQAVSVMLPDEREKLIGLVQAYKAFDPENDPYHEHDFGSIDFQGTRYFWKIDYYDKSLKAGSENPADPKQTTRVLTIMEASEY